MRPTSLLSSLTFFLLLVLLAGCSRPTPAEQAVALAASITEIRQTLPADPTAEQADGLAKPAKRADKAYATLLKLQQKYPQDTAIATARAQVEPLYAEVRRIRRVATEREDLADLMGGLKVRGYRAARTVVIPRLLSGLASAARQAAESDFDQLPKLVRETAQLAASLAGQPIEATGSPAAAPKVDWLQVAAQLETWNAAEPAEFPLALAIGYAAIGKPGFALVELDRIDPAKVGEPQHAALIPLARALIFSRLGFIELAALEANRISAEAETSHQMLATIHAVLAYVYASEKDWKQMDRELALAVRIWPNNPLVVFLSGERLLADGRREQALETFAHVAAGTDSDWLAPLIETRVRQVRDSKGEVPPMLLDNEFIVKCALHSLVQQANQSAAGRKIAGLLESARLLPSVLGGAGVESPSAPK